MVRGQGPPHHPHPFANGHQDNRDASSFTITAQLVNNLSTSDGRPQIDHGEIFQQLLGEVLGSGDASSSDTSAIDANPPNNHNLIVVVIRAGLEVLLVKNPFARVDHLLEQAKSSLTVLNLIIKRTPGVLFVETPNTEAGNGPLFLWVLPKLLALLSSRYCEQLRAPLTGTLTEMLASVSGHPDVWINIGTLLSYLKECVNVILESLKDLTSPQHNSKAPYKITLPPKHIYQSLLTPESSNFDVLGELFGWSVDALVTPLQVEVSGALLDCYRLAQMQKPRILAFEEYAVPSLTALGENHSRLDSLIPELQFAVRLWMRHLQPQADSVTELPPVPVDSAGGSDIMALRRDISKLTCSEGGPHTDEIERVPKRRRLLSYGDDGETYDSVKYLTKKVYGLLGSQDAEDLDGLSSIAVVVAHSASSMELSLASSPFGQWCLKSLHSSVRELRIAAGRTLATFLTSGIDEEILSENRMVAIDFLRKLSERSEVRLQETNVMAWGQCASVSADEELNLSLLRLVEYLGHSNPLIYGAAYSELLKLSQSQSITPQQLLSPFWQSIAVTVVKDLQTRPQTIQLLSDLL
ncbi:MAG: hypothetical protein M1825_004926, partial [Sarcosagium campestre]